MPTVIDSLSIEIESSSTNAAQGIEDLARALGELKKNGAVGVAVKNLNGLSSALKGMTSAASNANKISSLADAMAKLKSVGSTGTGVKNLVESLKEIKSIDYGAVQKAADSCATFEQLAASLSVLSSVKSGGVGSMVNGLSKIGDVTKKLDDDTIERFAERVALVSEKVGPLSEKMTTIAEAFKGINFALKQTNVRVGQANTRVNIGVFNLSNLANVLSKVRRALQAVVNKFSEFVQSAAEWDGIAARFGRGFGEQAQETYDWIQRLNKELGINTQQFMQYSSTYATMLTGFGVAQEDASKMALGYMELTYDVWAGYNDQYKTLADAAEAIRSAIAGEVEPVRKMGMTIVDSQLAATAANYGIAYSTQTATEELKSYLRYLTMVDQAYAQGLVGTYAKEMNTAEGVMRTFNQQLKSLAQSFGSLFLPALVRVMPYLQAFVDLMSEAVYRTAELFGVTIQPLDWSKSFNGITNSAEKATEAVKELKNATIGIDELNVIGDNGNSGADSDFGSALPDVGISSLWDESVFKGIQNKVDDIKEKFGDLLSAAIYVGETILVWKFATGFLKTLGTVTESVREITSGIKTAKTIGFGISLMVTGATLEFSGAYDLGYNGPTLENILKTALGSALGIGGSLLVFGTGPVGWTVGLGLALAVGLTAAVIGAKKAMEDIRTQIIESVVFDKEGIDIGEVAVNVTASIGNVQTQYDPAFDYISTIQKNTKVADDFATAYGNLFHGIQSGVRDATTTLPELTAAFKEMYNNTVETLNAQHDLIIYSLSGATGEALKDAGLDLLEIKDAFNRVNENMIADLDSYNKEYDRIASELENGTLTAGEACRQLEEARKTYSAVLDATDASGTKIVSEFKGAVFGVFDKVDLGSATEVAKAFETVGNAAETSIDSIKEYYKGLNEAEAVRLKYAKDTGDFGAVERIKQAMTANNTARDTAVSEIAGYYQEMIDTVYANLAFDLPDIANKAFEDYDTLPWFQRLSTTKADFVMATVEQYRKDTIAPITEGIKTALGEELAAQANLWGDEVITNFINEAFNVTTTEDAWGVKTTTTTIAKSFSEALNNILPDSLKEAGKNGVLGFQNGIMENAPLADAMKIVGSRAITAIEAVLDEHSPSKEMGTRGLWAVQGLANGFSENAYLVTNAVKSLARSVGSAWNSEISKVWFNLPTVIGSGLAKVSIPGFASGGFPVSGEMFVARENGVPEMVGRMGNRTAVANNDQIVEAISSGVYDAVVSAMDKFQGNQGGSMNVYLDGKQIMSSVEKHQRDRGRQIFAGGMI